MSEPVTRWEYRLMDGKGCKIRLTPEMKIREDEAASGVVGLFRWNQRVRELNEDIDHSLIRSYCIERGEKRTPLIELEMSLEDKGYVQFRGQFPIIII